MARNTHPGLRSARFHRRLCLVRRPALSAEELISRLDGELIGCMGESWRVNVYGSIVEYPCRWVQLGLEGSDHRSALLKVPRAADDVDILNAVESWLAESPDVHAGCLTVPVRDSLVPSFGRAH